MHGFGCGDFCVFPYQKMIKIIKVMMGFGRLGRFKCMIQWVPGTQITLVLIGKGLVLEGSTTKIEAVHRFQVYKLQQAWSCYFGTKNLAKGWDLRVVTPIYPVYKYPPVNKDSNGKSPSWIGNTSSNGGFSIAMLDYRSVGEITTHWSLTTYSNWKVDGTVSTHWFIIGPFTNLPFGICGICFDLKVLTSNGTSKCVTPTFVNLNTFLSRCLTFIFPFTRSDIWTLGEKSLKKKKKNTPQSQTCHGKI